jgi:hypothetical protein
VKSIPEGDDSLLDERRRSDIESESYLKKLALETNEK